MRDSNMRRLHYQDVPAALAHAAGTVLGTRTLLAQGCKALYSVRQHLELL